MNPIFFCQSRSLDVFYHIYRSLRQKEEIGRAGFYIANLRHYEIFLRSFPDFEKHVEVVKEWEIYEAADGHVPDMAKIEEMCLWIK